MTVHVEPLENCTDVLDFFLDDMTRVWEARSGSEIPTFKETTRTKILASLGKTYQGSVFFDDKKPVAIGWVEKTSLYYGNITLHAIDPVYYDALAQYMLDQGHFDNCILEVIHVVETDVFKDVYLKNGLTINYRERMALWLHQDYFYKEEPCPIPLDFYLMTEEYKDITARISHAAHQVSQDYPMNLEMRDLDKRIELEHRAFSGHYGPVIRDGSLLVFHNGQPIGYCLAVEVKCWGMEKMPWIFDIVIQPGFDGQGVGRELLKKSLNLMTENGYTLVGLAVTKSNYAKRLYEKLGFETVDDFYEFIRLV